MGSGHSSKVVETPGWLSSSFLPPPSPLLLPDDPPHPTPQSREDFAPFLPHRPAFFLRHYHPVKQRGQSGSIWITLTIAYYLAGLPHSPQVPIAAALGPKEPCLPSPTSGLGGGQGTGCLAALSLPDPSS